MGTVFRKNFELGRIRLKEDHVGEGTRSSWEFRSTLYSSFAFFYGLFTQPCSFGCGRIERSISECKHSRLKTWTRSLIQENPPTISDKLNVLERIAMESERMQVHFISGSL